MLNYMKIGLLRTEGHCVNVSFLEMGPSFYVVIRATRRSSRLKAADGRQYLTIISATF